MLRLGAILATSAAIFTLLRWIGGAYLVYLGIKLWRAPIQPEDIDDVPSANPLGMFCHSYAVTALNPKSIIFFVCFCFPVFGRNQLVLASDREVGGNVRYPRHAECGLVRSACRSGPAEIAGAGGSALSTGLGFTFGWRRCHCCRMAKGKFLN
jgi:hypothetical protein